MFYHFLLNLLTHTHTLSILTHTLYFFFCLTSSILYNTPISPPQFISTLKPSRELLREGRKFTFRITILQATGIPRDFTDIFLQFRFLNGGDEAFSTVSLKNENQDLALGFYHMQNVSHSQSHTQFYTHRSHNIALCIV